MNEDKLTKILKKVKKGKLKPKKARNLIIDLLIRKSKPTSPEPPKARIIREGETPEPPPKKN